MQFFKKDLNILILSSSSWRSRLFKDFFSAYANFSRFKKMESIPPKNELKKFDYVFCEFNSTFDPIIEIFDPAKIILFDYRDEGNKNNLQKQAARIGLKDFRYMLILTNKKSLNAFSLPLPLPKLNFKLKKTIPGLKNKKIHGSFLCSPTFLYLDKNCNYPYCAHLDGRQVYNQRLEWAEQLINSGIIQPNDGIVEPPKIAYLSKANTIELFKNPEYLFKPYLDKDNYISQMINSKLIFAPAGHSRFTYRHLEAMLYKGICISTDFENKEMRPPFPVHLFHSIKDGKFNISEIQEILDTADSWQEKVDNGFDWIMSTYKPKGMIKKKTVYSEKVLRKMFEDLKTFLLEPLN